MKKKQHSGSVIEMMKERIPTPVLIIIAGVLMFMSAVFYWESQDDQFVRKSFNSSVPQIAVGGYPAYDGDYETSSSYSGSGSGGGQRAEFDYVVVESRSIAPSPPYDGSGGIVVGGEQQLVKNGSLSLEVTDVEKTTSDLQTIARIYNGVVESSNISEGNRGLKTGHMMLRVPSIHFESAMESAKSIAINVTHESSNARDVASTLVDIDAQLRNLKAEEGQYVRILDDTAEVKDVLQVVAQLSRVRDRIERLEASREHLSTQVALSTISVSYSSPKAVQVFEKTWNPILTLKQGAQNLVGGLQGLADSLILLLFAVPIFLVWLAVLWIFLILFHKIILHIRKHLKK